jgi:Na+/proline symporter
MGVLMSRRASASLDDYFLGGKKLPWYLLGVAGMANWFDLTGTMIITAFLYMLGPRGLFIEFRGGAVLILAFMLAYAGKWHRRSGCVSRCRVDELPLRHRPSCEPGCG